MKTQTKEKDSERSENQAKCQLESIREMVKGLDSLNHAEQEEAQKTIQEDALEISVRSDWHTPGDKDIKDSEYLILLCTGGPACRIIGELDEHGQPESARIEHQDWGTPWTEYRITSEEEEDVLRYASCFWFGE